MQIEFPSGSETMAIRQTGDSNGSTVNFRLFARSLATAESKSSTSKGITGPSFEGFHSSDDILLIAKVDGPKIVFDPMTMPTLKGPGALQVLGRVCKSV